MKYTAAIVVLARLLNKQDAEDYVACPTMLELLEVQPVERRKGMTIYDRHDIDAAIEKRKLMSRADRGLEDKLNRKRKPTKNRGPESQSPP